MRTIYRDNYTPQLGDYHDRLIIDGAQEKKWLFDCDGVYTEMDGAEVVNEKGDSTTKAISQKLFTDETNSLTQDITDEANTRSESDRAIWQEIEDIEAASDVTDIVGTHADLENYDTSKLKDNDIIKVLEDETQGGQITYYRWDTDTEVFSLIGAIGPYYTKTEADNKFQNKLTAGANISIDANNEISATDTTYSNFVGTDGQDAGTAGLVPAPATTDTGKFLKADGTWDTVGGGIDPSTTFWGQGVVNSAVDGNINITKGGTARIMFRPANYNKGAAIAFQSSGIVEMEQMFKIGSSWNVNAPFLRAGTSEFKVLPIVSQMEPTPIMPTEDTDYTCKAYVDAQVGNIETILQTLNSGTGV